MILCTNMLLVSNAENLKQGYGAQNHHFTVQMPKYSRNPHSGIKWTIKINRAKGVPKLKTYKFLVH